MCLHGLHRAEALWHPVCCRGWWVAQGFSPGCVRGELARYIDITTTFVIARGAAPKQSPVSL